VCTHNSARSQLASALWARRSSVPTASAGTHPAARVHPLAAAVADEHGLPLSAARTAHVEDVLRVGDLVVAVCDNAHEELDRSVADRLHWSVSDPTTVGTSEAFEQAFWDIADRVDRLAPSVHRSGDHDDRH
jgi:protein-tyrosine-phosphatase